MISKRSAYVKQLNYLFNLTKLQKLKIGGETKIKCSTASKARRKHNKLVKTSLLAQLQKSYDTLVTYFSLKPSNVHNS